MNFRSHPVDLALLACALLATPSEAMERYQSKDSYQDNIGANPPQDAIKPRWSKTKKPSLRKTDSVISQNSDTTSPTLQKLPDFSSPRDSAAPANPGIAKFIALGPHLLVQTRDGAIFQRDGSDTAWTIPVNTPSGSLEFYAVDSSSVIHNHVGSLRQFRLSPDDSGRPRFETGPVLFAPGLLFPSHMAFLSQETGIVGSALNQALRHTRDGGRTWSDLTPRIQGGTFQGPRWNRIQKLSSNGIAFLVGDAGAVSRFEFSPAKLVALKAPGKADLRAVHFTSAAHGVVADDSGRIFVTSDSGATWTSHRLDTANSFRIADIGFDDPDRGFACGTDGAVFETRDAGATWHRITRTESVRPGVYRRLPPPLYYLLIALAVFVVWPAFKRQKPRVLHQGIGENLSSDKPLENASEDKLGMAVQANALTGFLMNPATKPPMTFAVLGEWGKGKSSFLRIAQKGLDRNGYVTVWFNAWHHQSEESLLAALLDNIRRSELLGFHTLDGFFFRLRLTWRRILPHIPRILIAIALSILLCVSLMELWERFPSGRRELKLLFQDFFGNSPALLDFAKGVLGGSPLLLAAIAVWKALKSVLVIFQTKPAELLASLSDSTKIADMSKKIGFRETFRGEFGEVANALADKPMVIFIDDLDRCRPQAVMATLEAINFLVTCGPCYFVIAMDKEQVSCAIISQDAAFIERFREENRSDKSYAQHYLEKLIQVELSVPQTDGKSFAALLKGSSPALTSPQRDWSWVRRYIPVLLCSGFAAVCLLFLVPRLSERVFASDSVVTADSTRVMLRDSAGRSPGDSALAPEATPPDLQAPSTSFPPLERVSAKPAFDSGKTDKFWSWIVPVSMVYLFLGFLVVAYFVWKDRKARDEFVDSESFGKALTDWGELVHLAARTPRGAKTYINRLRYFATLRREWKLQWDAVQALSTHPLPLPHLPEDEDLVALSCLELSLRTLLDQPYELGPENLELLIRWLEDPRQDRADIAVQVRGFLQGRTDWQSLLEGFALLGAQVDRK
ncbi:MAG: P-loop NTPase fold protein [Fibrobacterota bacterium]